MDTASKKVITFSRIIFIIVFVAGLLFPSGKIVLADDGVTPEASPEVVVVETPSAPDGGEQSSEDSAPLQPDESVQQQPEATELPQAVETGLPQPVETELPQAVDTGIVDEETPADVITAIADSGSVITDETGHELPMASTELANVIAGSDPYITRGLVTYRFMTDCSGFTNSATEQCIETPSPVQMAVNFAEPGETINIEANTYNETVQISSSVILNGIGGNAILDAFVLMAGENVGGSTNVFAPLIYVNNGASINDGLLLAQENGTVNVASGTYTEQIKIKKSVHLIGAGQSTTNILYASTLTPSGSMDVSAIMEISGLNTNAEISGFTIAGGPGLDATTDEIAGLYVFNGATANIHDNQISLGDTNGKTGVDIQIGRSYSTTEETHGHAQIWNNEIVNFATYGISVEADAYYDLTTDDRWVDGSSADIYNNTVDGSGITPIGNQTGIRIFNGYTVGDFNYFYNNVTATIHNNLVQNNAFAGIWLERARNVDVTGNVVTNNYNGVYMRHRVSGGVHYNSIYGNTHFDSDITGTPDTNMFNYNWWGLAPLMSNWITNSTLPWLTADPMPTVGVGASGNSWSWYGPDMDADGIPNETDNCPTVYNPTQDLAACNGDVDDDLILNNLDNCPTVANHDQMDTDEDGVGDACDTDVDGDGVPNAVDNCPLVANADQTDTNANGLGDACDPDMDGDGVLNAIDNCPLVANADQTDTNGNGLGDACDADMDGDGVLNAVDNCPLVANADQIDTNANGQGDACDPDMDGDGVLNAVDNCPLISNADQTDTNANGQGDACDPDMDGDGVINEVDNCPYISNPNQSDKDQDGVGDACDQDNGNGGDGYLAVIPVTGSELMSCTEPETLEIPLPGEGKLIVSFNKILCGYQSTLTLEVLDALPGGFPDGTTPVTALTFTLTKDGVAFVDLPEDTLVTVKFYAGSTSDNYSILFWDAAAGKWEDLGGSLKDGYFEVTSSFAGSFVLVTK